MKKTKHIPLFEMIESELNIYEMTNAAIKRAEQISKTGNEDVANDRDKIVSLALREVIEETVTYQKI